MKVLVDTPIWSLALRRKPDRLSATEQRFIDHWRKHVAEGAAAIIGPVRQEVLSGIRDVSAFDRIQILLDGIDMIELTKADYDNAAKAYNLLRSKGIQGGDVDLEICAVAIRVNAQVFTADADFPRYAKHLPVHLYDASGSVVKP